MLTVGCRAIEVMDLVQAARVPMWLLYPAEGEAREERFGTYSLDVAMGAPCVGETFSLVVISHGTGSTPWVLRDMASYLVRAGFVVALFAHPGNTRMDDALANTRENLVNRPRHVVVVIDAAFADPEIGPRLSKSGVGVIGHSLGGYTALAVAGGNPVSLPHDNPDRLPDGDERGALLVPQPVPARDDRSPVPTVTGPSGLRSLCVSPEAVR